MIFDRKVLAGEEFRASDLLRPHLRTLPPTQESRPPHAVTVPGFLVRRDFFRGSWFETLKVALAPYPVHLKNVSTPLFQQIPVRPGTFVFRPMTLSLGLHMIAVLCLPFLLSFLPFRVRQFTSAPDHQESTEVMYYRLVTPRHPQMVPTILPKAGSRSEPGSQLESPAARGGVSAAQLYAISHPRLPDNDHQTILQSQSAPELRIKTDLKLPNLIVQELAAPRKPLNFPSKSVRPLMPVKKDVSIVEPRLKVAAQAESLTAELAALDPHPRLAVPVGAAPAPNLPTTHAVAPSGIEAPEIATVAGSSGRQLLVLGTDPAAPAALVALPAGNRLGQFSLAPGGSHVGSAGNEAGGGAGGAAGNGGVAGGKSGGSGTGASGEGAGDSAGSGFVALRGTGGSREGGEGPILNPTDAMVFALPKLSGPRRPAMLVTAGPIGGGGLGVYGALHCGKIYTVLLPISGRSWTLQFCQTPMPGAAAPVQYRSTVVHLEEALLPPEAETRYDFKRLPLPPEKMHKLIILKGTILPEGAVQNLTIHEGLLPQMDAAALRAFSQWTFKPAMRGGKPVSVDVLVGIPGDGPTAKLGMTGKLEAGKAQAQADGRNY